MPASSDSAAPGGAVGSAGGGPPRSALSRAYTRAVRRFERHSWLFDALFKAGPLVFLSVLIYPISQNEGAFFAGDESTPWPFQFALELLAILPLAFSRLRPGTAAGIIAFSCLCQLISGLGPALSAFSAPLVVYACAKYGSRRVSLGYLAAALAGSGLLGLFVLVTPYLRFPEFAPDLTWALFMMLLFAGFAAAVVLAAWLFGDMAGRRRREIAAITERNDLLERERDHEARLAADAERMRIAREMHDVVSHSMSVMIAQSDGGRYVVDQDPRRAAKAFETIGETGREALTELRRMLGVLREEEDPRRRPAPGLQDLPRLLEDVRASGLTVQAQVMGPNGSGSAGTVSPASPHALGAPTAGGTDAEASGAGSAGRPQERLEDFAAAVSSLPALPEGVGLAAYRIVQEALTNTLKHAGGQARAVVRIGIMELGVAGERSAEDRVVLQERMGHARSWHGAAGAVGRMLVVEIRDRGLGSRAGGDGAGSGLLGMQERARLYGGTVQARAHGEGFDVVARFPLDSGVVLGAEASAAQTGALSAAAEGAPAPGAASLPVAPVAPVDGSTQEGPLPGASPQGSAVPGTAPDAAGARGRTAGENDEGRGSDEF